ncbi:hypothetical protein LTR70_010265 [Exophiala xenobiotica]|uniref:AAA+ ATPase domain-containing protein n=1 Tax=Lithohypha guttulata TaxID=1690604 RepID=A0ABR0JWP7_9EURO|nr:hypothetical protein LTR24_009672 [Lithohypha guttulata]KAK5309471.1 hypothetical protein LTR70_010265 [Exophiala xenobiotica]
MRLLHFDDTGELVLTDFSGRTIPPYAILSHRWGDDEVLFEDLVYNGYEGKTGYQKIEFCAKLAVQDRLQYFWIDTCCIDKWNLRELSKAINSMFRWYRNATKCYVFLSDVSVSTATDIHRQSTWEASFRASKWFTRGWTLQELIAPESVEFFSSEGRRLGDKRSLEQLVHEITSIPVKALQGCPLENFSVPERMAWAKPRKTTEPEDSAYCLLGILGVHIPTSYGEGEEKALRRLHDELEATSTTLSIIPFSRNLQFVGRESQLTELEAKLFGDKQYTTIAITGAGGTGKSQLALELAYRTKRKNPSCSVFWIDASDIDSLHQAYSSIAQKLDVPGWDDEKADIKQLVKLYLRKSARQWLLIFDNADNENLGSTGLSTPRSANLIDYLPQSKLGSIIFTTTNGDIAKTVATQNIIELQEMTPDSAQMMLENHITSSVLTSEKQEMKLLLGELSYLPLAIVQAAAYINIKNITLKDYRLQIVQQKKEALDHFADCLVVGELTTSDTKTWKMKFVQLATYMRDVFSAQPTRRFVHGFLIFGVQMQLWVFDRSGAYSSQKFEIHQEPQQFIQVLVGYTLMTAGQLGLDTFVQSDGLYPSVTLLDPVTRKDCVFQLEDFPFFKQPAIVCRGTTCYRTTDGKHVVKFSWRADKQRSEVDHLTEAQGI